MSISRPHRAHRSARSASRQSPFHRVDALEARVLLAANVVISEFMASNLSGIVDEDSAHSDWIELQNNDAVPVNLAGWSLTDNAAALNKWVFPSVSIPVGGHLVVFASGKDRTSGPFLHTNFSLSVSGEYLGLVRPDQSIASDYGPSFPSQENDISYGLDNGTQRFFATPTPGEDNERAEVVINEIHYDPDVKTELVEFIELYNPGPGSVDLSGSSFTSGISYTFPASTTLGPNSYIVVAANPAAVAAKFPGVTALGPWTGSLNNEGDDVVLRNPMGGKLDEVQYKQGFPWPLVGDAPGYSIQLINPDFDNNLGGNWRSFSGSIIPDTTLFASSTAWSYRKGTSEASNPRSAWRQEGFAMDSTWYSGYGPIGYDGYTAFSRQPADQRHGGQLHLDLHAQDLRHRQCRRHQRIADGGQVR